MSTCPHDNILRRTNNYGDGFLNSPFCVKKHSIKKEVEKTEFTKSPKEMTE